MQSRARPPVHALPDLYSERGAYMSWRGDIAMGKYGKLPCALIDNNMFPSVEVDARRLSSPALTAARKYRVSTFGLSMRATDSATK